MPALKVQGRGLGRCLAFNGQDEIHFGEIYYSATIWIYVQKIIHLVLRQTESGRELGIARI
jgi:hypothetical protein